MKRGGVIVSFGGGGFTHGADPDLEDFCLGLLPPEPALGYIGWANDDDAVRVDRFHARFRGTAGSLSHLPASCSDGDILEWLAGKDMVYFGGGNTARLIDRLASGHAGAAFLSANKAGCVLAGVSAGGACWFDWILSDSRGPGYQPLQGLGAVAGGVCPHYDSEPARKPLFDLAASRHPGMAAFAIDDGAGIVAVDGEVRGYVSARRTSAAYRLTPNGGLTEPSPLPAFSRGAH